MQSKPKLTFDCSGLNKLADDADAHALLAGITESFFLRVTATNLEEIAACRAPRSKQLMEVAKRLIYAGDCIQSFGMIVEGLIGQSINDSTLPWAAFNPRWLNGESEAARQTLLTTEMAAKQKAVLSRLDKNFKGMFEKVRPQFEKLFADGGNLPNDFQELAVVMEENPSTYWNFAMMVYEDSAKHRPDQQTLAKLLDRCPPFRALVWAFCVAEYERCIRDVRAGPSLRAGRCDVYSAVYLPYCDQFVTADKKQCAALREVVKAAKVDTEVLLYTEFTGRILGGKYQQ
ncbi:MAG TPA: hypothetical protein VGK01_26485 [Candidatus Angelobacter sp.]|jgi:hypothetical protein